MIDANIPDRKVLRQLKAVVTHNVDMENISEEDLGKHLDKALRHALDVNYEELKKLNLGAMYVPMEKNPANSKAVSRENTDYDTFGSIDSLIFEPKIPTEEDIEEVQEEITQSFEYLENEDDGQDIKEKEDSILATIILLTTSLLWTSIVQIVITFCLSPLVRLPSSRVMRLFSIPICLL